MLNDLGREAIPAVADLVHPRWATRPPTTPQALSAVTMPFGMHMIDALEKRLIEALKSVDAYGDFAPAHVHDPMTMLLRENAIQANLMPGIT